MNPIFDESNETHVPAKSIVLKYPQRSNKGVPKKQYEPNPKAKTKYLISNHVTSHRLSESYAFTLNQLSTVFIPGSVHGSIDKSKMDKGDERRDGGSTKECHL